MLREVAKDTKIYSDINAISINTINIYGGSTLLKRSFKLVKFFGVLALIVLLSYFAMTKLGFKIVSQPKIDNTFVNSKLKDMSELSTEELSYTGLIVYEEGKIPFISKKGFSMIYTSKIRAGIDFKKVDIKVSDDTVTITVPKAQILSTDVDPNSIKFYDKKSALFNWSENNDVTDSLKHAKEDVLKKADTKTLLERSDKQTETLLREVLKNSVGDRNINVIKK